MCVYVCVYELLGLLYCQFARTTIINNLIGGINNLNAQWNFVRCNSIAWRGKLFDLV